MHPAMFLLDKQAQFRDPGSGERIRPGSYPHQIGDFVMAAVRAGFRLDGVDEQTPDAELAARCPRAEKYINWPMLVLMRLRHGP
jgi:malonyl-CoA O-methyltransferase